MLSRETHGNVRREEGNNPDRQLRSQIKWETMWEGPDSQDVGLESFKESVIAHWSSRPARKMAKPCTEAAAATLCVVG